VKAARTIDREMRLRHVRRARSLSEKTGTDHTCTHRKDAKGDEEAPCVVAIALGSSATLVVVASSAARRSAAFHLRFRFFGRARDALRGGVIDAASDMRSVGWLVPATPARASTPR